MSAMSLFALTGEYRAAAEKLADLDLDAATIANTLESLPGDLEVKATNVAKFFISLDVLAAGAKQRADEMAARAKAIQARADSMKEYLRSNLEAAGIEKIETDELCITWRKSSAVVIDGADLIPDEFMRQKPAPEPEPDKKAIADAIKAGAHIPGAHIEQRRSLTIR